MISKKRTGKLVALAFAAFIVFTVMACPNLPGDSPEYVAPVTGMSPGDGRICFSDKPTLSWTAVEGSAGYELQLATSEAGLAAATETPASASFSPAMALDFLSTYYWRVRAIDADGQCCPWSAIHSFTVASGEIASGTMVPSNDTTTAQSTSTPTLGWVGPEGAVSYEVAFGLSTGSLETAIATEAAYTFAVPLPEATVYWWRVRAIDGIGGAGAWSTFSSFKSK